MRTGMALHWTGSLGSFDGRARVRFMAKSAINFVCQSCGASTSKWAGKCEACGGWNTITEEGAAPPTGGSATPRVRGRKVALEDLKCDDLPPSRRVTGITE